MADLTPQSDPVAQLQALLDEAGLKPYFKFCADCDHPAHQTAGCRHCGHDAPSVRHRKQDGSAAP